MKKILVTGGAGYIGSHTCIELLNSDFEVVVLDNLSNSSVESLKRVELLTGKSLVFIEGDIRDNALLDRIFATYNIDAVIHFAGLKAVGEAEEVPLIYFNNNIAGSISLITAMEKAKVFNLVFSSSATVYGDDNTPPLKETMPTGRGLNNYGYTKLIVEQMLERLADSNPLWSFALLRYFNPVGAHNSGMIGEDPLGIPNNLMPYITQVAIGKRAQLSIFGNDYDTEDGTGVRDYIHVVDLAKAHVCAVQNRIDTDSGCRVWNIGTGKGVSVLTMKDTFEEVNNIKIPFQMIARRAGDVAVSYADNERAIEELNWSPTHTLQDMLKDSWNWQKKNPKGYNE